MEPIIHECIKYLRRQKSLKCLMRTLDPFAKGLQRSRLFKKNKRKISKRITEKVNRYKTGKFKSRDFTQKLLHFIEEVNEFKQEKTWEELADVLAQYSILKKDVKI